MNRFLPIGLSLLLITLLSCGEEESSPAQVQATHDSGTGSTDSSDDSMLLDTSDDQAPDRDITTPDADIPLDDIPSYIVEATSGEWTAIGTNAMTDVIFDYGSAATPDGFRSNLQGIMDAWSGGTYASPHHRLYVNGGGHGDYDGNEWYAFDVSHQRWERINDPSLYRPGTSADGIYPDGAPEPIHTYNNLVYAPTTNKLYRAGKSGSPLSNLWAFDLNTKKWEKTPVPANDPHGNVARWDPTTNRVFLCRNSSQASGYTYIVWFDPITSTLTDTGAATRWYSGTGALDTTHGEFVYTGGKQAPIRVNTTTYEITNVDVTGDTEIQNVPAPGFVYDSRRDRFTAWGAAGDTRTLYHISRKDWKWTAETPTTGDTPGAPNANGIYGRFQYIPHGGVL
ncbi:MAG TPA: hypothetical protein PLJ27_13620 [Polyangiaceae bacterium]|nr:MAG: hypothetical protein BWY17_05041 [Deltaproteobacteria bacterium ADurb.Bin207]HNS98850.1 hypothetical protein [Polyangiaceae bacterium]HNZ25489.1 hypothetical protein [Polyangiaceae bacterium]HOD25724.1 hypothetical protein [Polyangiaceae bacterium]HOE51459.1 hypothetical protein [Polyangiaceae bacterium]